MAKSKYIIELTALDKTKKAFSDVKKGLGSVGSAYAGVGKAIAGVTVAFTAAAATLAVVAKKSFDFADAIGKVSTRTGIATDAIQAFQIAAVLAGGTTDGANTALEKFTRSVGDAQRGLKTMTDIFKDLGVEIEDVNGVTKSMDVLLIEVTEAISNMSSQSEKATVAANLFGRQGIKLLGAIDSLGLSLGDFIEQAQAFGLILSEDSIKKSELFNDTMFVLSRQFKVLTAELAVAFLPVFQLVAATMVNNTKEFAEGEGGLKKFAETIRDQVLVGVISFLKFIKELLTSQGGIREYFFIFGKQLENIDRYFALVNQGFVAFVHFATFDFVKGMEAMDEYGNLARNSFINLSDALAEFRLENEGMSTQLDKTIKDLENFLNTGELLDEETKKLIADLFGVSEGLNTIENSLTNIQSPFDVFRSSLTDTEERTKAFETTVVGAFKKTEDALVEFVRSGKLNFKNLVDSIITELLRLAIQERIIAPLFDFLFPLVGQRAASTGTDAMQARMAQLGKIKLPTNEGGGFTGFGNRTGGLDGRGGFPAILHPNETVIDHTKGQQMAQQPVNVNFSIQATDASGIDELLNSRKNQIVAMISQAMNQKGKVGLI